MIKGWDAELLQTSLTTGIVLGSRQLRDQGIRLGFLNRPEAWALIIPAKGTARVRWM